VALLKLVKLEWRISRPKGKHFQADKILNHILMPPKYLTGASRMPVKLVTRIFRYYDPRAVGLKT
jgi:hypothetical protein